MTSLIGSIAIVLVGIAVVAGGLYVIFRGVVEVRSRLGARSRQPGGGQS